MKSKRVQLVFSCLWVKTRVFFSFGDRLCVSHEMAEAILRSFANLLPRPSRLQRKSGTKQRGLSRVVSAIQAWFHYLQESLNKRALGTSHGQQTLPVVPVTDYRAAKWSSFAPNVDGFSTSQWTEGVLKLPTGSEHKSEIFPVLRNDIFMSFTHYFTFRVNKTSSRTSFSEISPVRY